MLCRDTSRGRLSRRLACLRSHALRAYCNFKSKQAISITLFGRRPNNKTRNERLATGRGIQSKSFVYSCLFAESLISNFFLQSRKTLKTHIIKCQYGINK